MREKALDALLKAAIKTIEQLEGLVAMVSGLNDPTKRRAPVSSELREIAELIDRLPALSNDLYTLKKRLRGMLSFDPDKTPVAMPARELPTDPEATRFSPVEDRRNSGVQIRHTPKKEE